MHVGMPSISNSNGNHPNTIDYPCNDGALHLLFLSGEENSSSNIFIAYENKILASAFQIDQDRKLNPKNRSSVLES